MLAATRRRPTITAGVPNTHRKKVRESEINDDETSDAVVDPANIKLQVIEADAGWQKDFLDRATK
jgi:hypothetical protein